MCQDGGTWPSNHNTHTTDTVPGAPGPVRICMQPAHGTEAEVYRLLKAKTACSTQCVACIQFCAVLYRT